MNELNKFVKHLGYHLLEEFRLHTSFIGRFQFVFFPVLMTVMVLVISLASPVLLKGVSLRTGLSILHLTMFIYGLGLGMFALMADSIAERRWGKMSMLLTAPTLQPVSFRYNFLVFYVKDIIYYILFSILPLAIGIGLSLPFTDHSIADVGLLMACVFLTFLIGISLSFFLSSLAVRSKPVFAVAILLIAGLIAAAFFLPYYRPENLLPSLMFNLRLDWYYVAISIALALIFSTLAVFLIKVERTAKRETTKPQLLKNRALFSFSKAYSPYLAKEWSDLKRTRMLGTFFGVYIGPLLFISLILWFFSKVMSLEIPINIIFFGAMIGFLGVTAYSFLNLLDSQTFNQTLPMTVAVLIRTKLIMFLLLTLVTSSVYLIGISIFMGDLDILWLGLIVSLTTTVYCVIVTAYLTGLKTNTYLFSPKILLKFAGLVATPLVMMTIASFIMEDLFLYPVIFIILVCGAMVGLAMFFYRGIEKRWAEASFLD